MANEANSYHPGQEKQHLIQRSLESGTVTPQFAQLLSEIKIREQGRVDDANKVRLVLALRERLAADGIGAGRVAYPASGRDWQFPVALGCRRIDMIDPNLRLESERQRLIESTQSFGRDVILAGDTVTFSIDLGRGLEEVNLTLYPLYDEEYVGAEPLVGVLEYLPPPKHTVGPVKGNIAKALKSGAIIANFGDSRLQAGTAVDEQARGVKRVNVNGAAYYIVTDPEKVYQWSLEPIDMGGRPIPKNPHHDQNARGGVVDMSLLRAVAADIARIKKRIEGGEKVRALIGRPKSFEKRFLDALGQQTALGKSETIISDQERERLLKTIDEVRGLVMKDGEPWFSVNPEDRDYYGDEPEVLEALEQTVCLGSQSIKAHAMIVEDIDRFPHEESLGFYAHEDQLLPNDSQLNFYPDGSYSLDLAGEHTYHSGLDPQPLESMSDEEYRIAMYVLTAFQRQYKLFFN